MEKKQSLYESIFVINSALGEEAVNALQDKFTSLIEANGTVEEINVWGKRTLAYPINDFTEGNYVLVKFRAPAAFPAELDRVYKITDGILRSLIVKIEEKRKKAAVAPKEEPAAEETEA